MIMIRMPLASILSVLITGACALASEPAKCDGHGINPKYQIQTGEVIQVQVTADDQTVEAGFPRDLGPRSVGAAIKFHVGAYDKDDHVCQIPMAPVKNYILDAVEREVPDPENPGQTKRVKAPVQVSIYLKGEGGNPDVPLTTRALVTAPADPPVTDRAWDGTWAIPESAVPAGGGAAISLAGRRLAFKFIGIVDDFPCTADRHAKSNDEPVDLDARGYIAEITVQLPMPHPPGDYSVDAAGKDCESTGQPWVATKYYYVLAKDKFRTAKTGYGSDLYQSDARLETAVQGSTNFTAKVDRFFFSGAVLSTVTQDMLDNGIVSGTAKIRVCLGRREGNIQISFGRTSVNAPAGEGVAVFSLDGDSRDLLLPTALGRNGNRPSGRDNAISFSGPAGANLTVLWIELSFDAMSPYILVHGKGCDGTFWEAKRPGSVTVCWPPFVEGLRTFRVPYDNSISLKGNYNEKPSNDSVANQAEDLNTQILSVLPSLGTRHLNFICHSKGGLDTRYWLTEWNPKGYIVGNFITLCTPHRGSAIADIVAVGSSISYSTIVANRRAGNIPFDVMLQMIDFHTAVSIPFMGREDTPAVYSLRTSSLTPDRRSVPLSDDTATYNGTFGSKLPSYNNVDGTVPTFLCTKAMVDRNGDGMLSISTEIPELKAWEKSSYYGANLAFAAMARIKQMQQPPGATFRLWMRQWPLLVPKLYPNTTNEPNDLLVSFDSAVYGPFGEIPFGRNTLFLQPSGFPGVLGYDHGAAVRRELALQMASMSSIIPPLR